MMMLRAMHAVAVLTVLPLVTLRGRSLRRYFAVDAVTWVLAAVVWRHADLDPYFAAVGLVVVKLATFCVFLATAKDARWSANRGAFAALLVYTLLVPAMQRTPVDGDEPFYLLVTESMIRDFDLDLANQYAGGALSRMRRPDLRPQPGDPTGPSGEQYSRHEPLLSVLLVPGYAIAGVGGALATMALFAALLVRSTLRLFEEEGIDGAVARLVFPFFAFGPPVVFYAARVWPEVPAAFFLVEAIRGVRDRRMQKWIPALLFLALLKLRFVLIAAPLVVRAVARSKRQAILAPLVVGLPLLVLWLITGDATSVHSIGDLFAPSAGGPFHGLFGLVLDGAAGIAFQAPFYLLGVFALVRWREMPVAFRMGVVSSLIYLALLIPRSEWHGGWSPPLRYIVFLMPVLALGGAKLLSRHASHAALLGMIGLWTIGLVAHGVAHPWRLFHIANGENLAGETLSRLYASDFSRLFPSFIRLNQAAIVASIVLAGSLVVYAFGRRGRLPAPLVVSIVTLLLAAGFVAGQRPGKRVEFEDAHVIHRGGELYPHEYTVARFAHRAGWIIHGGESMSFLARRGPADIHYTTGLATAIRLGGRTYELEAGPGYRTLPVYIEESGRVVLHCLHGGVNLDRLESR